VTAIIIKLRMKPLCSWSTANTIRKVILGEAVRISVEFSWLGKDVYFFRWVVNVDVAAKVCSVQIITPILYAPETAILIKGQANFVTETICKDKSGIPIQRNRPRNIEAVDAGTRRVAVYIGTAAKTYVK